MPVHSGKDKGGCFWQWGNQKKYYYECDNKDASEDAKEKAKKQGQAVEISRNCCFDLKLSAEDITDSNISEEFIILEHKEDDNFEYRNGMLSFTLSKKKLDQMANSFKKRDRELYINYDHEADGTTRAAGWFNNIRSGKTENGYALFAKAEWTPNAKKAIQDKEYKYFSSECKIEGMCVKFGEEIVYDPKYKKSTIDGGALTNNPFFKTANLSLSNEQEQNMEDNMPDVTELNADFEQFKNDKSIEIANLNNQINTFKLEIDKKDAEIVKLSNEIMDIKKSNKDAMIASFISRLPDEQEKRELVRVKLEQLSEKLNGAEFSEMAELIIAQYDKRIDVKNANIEFKNTNNNQSLSPAKWDDFIQKTKNEIKE